MSAPPIPMRWDGESLTPLPSFARRADDYYVIGKVYRIVDLEDRSDVSHRHEFAWLREAWQNLPEQLQDEFPSPEHLRKRALIECGFYDQTIIDVGSKAGAMRVAQYARGEDEYAVAVVRGPIVVVRKAKSQSRRAMDKHEFQASKTAILEWVATLLGVTSEQLSTAAQGGAGAKNLRAEAA